MIETAIICLALNIYHESRFEEVNGQKAVAQVTMNRAKNNPENVCGEVFKPLQFSWANPLTTVDNETRVQRSTAYIPNDDKAWKLAKSIAKKAIYGKLENIISDARYFYNPNKSNPTWVNNMVVVAQIGNHVFLKTKSS